MSLQTGTRLGPYEILAPLGAGGMGEVYRARDTRLDRTVAIKVLPSNLAADLQLRDRFEREARAISSLQHPHICALYDVGDAPHPGSSAAGNATLQFLVLEYLEGETLAARLARTGALSLGEALKIGREICDALDKAHRSHIVHRDLKPANVMLTKSGAKLLDFGLAKSAVPVVASGLSMLPTTPPALTQQGTILGTFQYMAPEQIEGLEADARTDIFAFGAMLFETLTGRPPFEGKSRASLLGAILKDDPPPVSSLKPATPNAIDRIVSVCLAKDPDDRYQTARDLLRDLKSIDPTAATPTPHSEAVRSRKSMWLPVIISATAAAIAGIALGRFLPRPAQPVAEPVQFTLGPPPSHTFTSPPGGGTGLVPQVALSPDGRQIAFVASGPNAFQLWIRPLGSVAARPLAGTDDASFPFWSPDGRYIGFFAQGSLKKVAIDGGGSVVVCEAIAGRGGSWNKDNVIVFTPNTTGPLQRVSAAGGVPTAASVLDPKVGDTNHRFPLFLPDGRHFLFTSVYGTCCPAIRPGHIKVGVLDAMDVSELLQVESAASYAAGHVLFNRAGVLMAQPLDTATRTLTGEPFTVADRVASEGSRYASVSASDGNLVYFSGSGSSLSRLDWYDRSGNLQGTAADEGSWLGPNLSPDGRRIAVAATTGTPPNRDIWILDTVDKTRAHLTFDPGDDNAPVWSPDQKYVAYQGNRAGMATLLRKEVNGGKDEEVLVQREEVTPGAMLPSDWSSDGRYLLFSRSQGVEGSTDVWVLPLFGDQKPSPVLRTRATETTAVFSPDARWLAYTSNESGSPQIYVQPFPVTGAKYHISQGGGSTAIQPHWSKDGREILYIDLDASGSRLMSVTVRTTPDFQAGAPSPLFRFSTISAYGFGAFRNYSMTNDGKRLLVATVQQQVNAPMTVMLNWLSARR